MSTDGIQSNPIENLFYELSQDIYIACSDGELKHIPYHTYNEAPELEWYKKVDGVEQLQIFFTTENGYQPANLYGPVITKVLPWNLATANVPPGTNRSDFKPGYLIDLRLLRLARLRFNEANKNNANRGDANTGDIKPYDGNLPEQLLGELQLTPEDNLYIASWIDPFAKGSELGHQDYHLTYLSCEELARCRNATDVDDGDTKTMLERYYVEAGVQAGAIHPLDTGILPFLESTPAENLKEMAPAEFSATFGIAPTCYIVNLKSFML